MTHEQPLVSIGLPTYNGGRYIRDALESLLAQDYPNFEILVSDNASTDDTPEILAEYAERDPRIRVVRQTRNIGPPANFNYVFRETRGPFFMWVADDDRWEPGYVRECVTALATTPAAVLACTRIHFLRSDGTPFTPPLPLTDNPDLSSPSIERRVERLLSRYYWYTIFGLARRDSLASTRLIAEGFGADVVLTLELALLGPFVLVPRVLHEIRLFENREEPDRGVWNSGIPDLSRVRAAPWTRLQEGCAGAISAAPIGRRAKARAWVGLMRAFYLRPTPMRGRIVAEIDVRLRSALMERDLRHVVVYLGLKVAVAVHRLVPGR